MSMLCDASRSTLVLIDLQERLMPVIHDGAAVVRNALILAHAARLLNIPAVGTEQYPAGLGPNVPEIRELCDQTIGKLHFDACAEPDLLATLTPGHELVVAGCEAHVCLLQTVLGLLAHQRRVWLVADAIGSRVPTNKAIALERAKAAGARIVTTEMVIFEWLRHCEHARFRDVLKLVK